MFLDYESPKLPQPLIFLITQIHDLKRSILSVLLCLPTSLLALLLVLLLAFNGFYVFSFHLSFPSNSQPNFSPGESGSKLAPPAHISSSSKSKLSSSAMYVVKEENAPMFLKTQLSPLHTQKNPSVSISKFSILRTRRPRKHKRKLKSLPSDSNNPHFPTRIGNFFSGFNSSSPCKFRVFMTWISSKPFGKRELLAAGTLFKSHPNACLVIVSKSLDSDRGAKILNPFSEMGFRVMAIAPDFSYLFSKTPAENWYHELRKGNVNPGGVSLGQNLSNLLRLALLYKFGGIYLDTDVIVLKSLSKLRNVIGAQTIDSQTGNWSRLNNAVLVFDKNHPLVFKFIQEFALTFDGSKWGHNGPYLVSRVVSRVSSKADQNPGFNFTVLTPSAFYPVNWSRIRSLFRGPKDELHSRLLLRKMRHIRSQSFALHLWNSQSKRLQVEKGSIIDQIMSQYSIFSNSSSSSFVNIE